VYAVDRHAEFAYRLPNAQPVVASTSDVIEELLGRLPAPPAASQYPRPAGPLRVMPRSQAGPVHPSHLMHWLSQTLPEDVVVHIDAGNSFSWSTRDLVRPMPDTYRVAMGLSTMCWAISAVIGATVARSRRSICICGDGSMLMSSLELTVAVQHRLPVTYIVLNDSSLGMVRHGQKLGGAESIGHEIASVRFDHLAQACGARGARVECSDDLPGLPLEWLCDDDGGPSVIDVCIDREAVPPMADRVRGLAEGVSR
jgi:acetolactate synthase I/II/III large subunit